MQHLPGPDRALDPEIVTVIAVKPAQGFDDQEIHLQPDRPAPIRVPAEHAALRIARHIADAQPRRPVLEDIRMLPVLLSCLRAQWCLARPAWLCDRQRRASSAWSKPSTR